MTAARMVLNTRRSEPEQANEGETHAMRSSSGRNHYGVAASLAGRTNPGDRRVRPRVDGRGGRHVRRLRPRPAAAAPSPDPAPNRRLGPARRTAPLAGHHSMHSSASSQCSRARRPQVRVRHRRWNARCAHRTPGALRSPSVRPNPASKGTPEEEHRAGKRGTSTRTPSDSSYATGRAQALGVG